MECSICTEIRECLRCPMCNVNLCGDCFKYSITMELRDPQCIYCKKLLSIDYILENNETEWLKKDFLPFMGNLIMEKEKMLLPSTIDEYNKMKQIEEYKLERASLPLIKVIKNKFKDEKIFIREKELRNIKYHELTNKINDISNNKIRHTQKSYILKCIIENCKGFIDTDYNCGICHIKICQVCLNELSDEHKCNSDDIKFADIIRLQSKPCPKCYVPIIKSGGCDQMFCTNCNTAFSWITGKIELGAIHNPHYYEWLEKNPMTQQQLENIACGNINDYYTFFIAYVRENNLTLRKAFQKIAHTQNILLPIVAENRVADNLDLRLKYLDNKITEEMWKSTLIKREIKRNKNTAIRHVLEMYITIASDIIRQVTHTPRLINEKNNEYLALMDYINSCFDKICMIHGGNINNNILTVFMKEKY